MTNATTRLYFYRHAPALSRSEWDGPDSDRPLSDDGIATARRVSKAIAKMHLDIGAILASPYARAWHTGEILEEALGSPGLLVAERGLEPSAFDIAALDRMLAAHPDAPSLMLIGHEPSMTEVMSDVIGGGELVLKKAGFARIDLAYGASHATGMLRWLMPPRLLG